MKTDIIYESQLVRGYNPGYWHPFPQEKPEADRLLYVIDAKGNRQGHLGTKIVWDGEGFRTDLAHRLLVDPDNIVGWRYLETVGNRDVIEENKN